VPDVATVAADYPEGVHGLVSSTMANEETRLQKVIRGHHGSFVFNGDVIEFIPERPQVTRDSSLTTERIEAPTVEDDNYTHFENWLAAIQAGDPQMCNNPPDLGAAAVTTVILGAQSYREGIVYYFDPERGPYPAHEAHHHWPDQWSSSPNSGANRATSRVGRPATTAARWRNRPTCRWPVRGSTGNHRRRAGDVISGRQVALHERRRAAGIE